MSRQTNTNGVGFGDKDTEARKWVVSLVPEYEEGLNAVRSVSKIA